MTLDNVVIELEKITTNTLEIEEIKNIVISNQQYNQEVFLFFTIAFIIIISVLIMGVVSNAIR